MGAALGLETDEVVKQSGYHEQQIDVTRVQRPLPGGRLQPSDGRIAEINGLEKSPPQQW